MTYSLVLVDLDEMADLDIGRWNRNDARARDALVLLPVDLLVSLVSFVIIVALLGHTDANDEHQWRNVREEESCSAGIPQVRTRRTQRTIRWRYRCRDAAHAPTLRMGIS